MKTLLALLLLIPSFSLGHEDKFPFLGGEKALADKINKYCEETIEYKKWYEMNKKILDNRNVYFHKCILDHSKKESSLSEETIFNSCSIISQDKYQTKGEEPLKKYMHKDTQEFGSNYLICHEH